MEKISEFSSLAHAMELPGIDLKRYCQRFLFCFLIIFLCCGFQLLALHAIGAKTLDASDFVITDAPVKYNGIWCKKVRMTMLPNRLTDILSLQGQLNVDAQGCGLDLANSSWSTSLGHASMQIVPSASVPDIVDVNFHIWADFPWKGENEIWLEWILVPQAGETLRNVHVQINGIVQVDILVDFFELPTATDDLDANASISVYPNPVTDIVCIREGEMQGAERRVEVLDATGKILISRMMRCNETCLEVEQLPVGIYALRWGMAHLPMRHVKIIKQ